jgi:type I restriction enzyme, S subunit
MGFETVAFSQLLREIVDNRGRTCPTADRGILLIATNCIRNELLYPTYEKARFVSQDTYSTWFRGHPKPGDILFVNKATPGRVCLVPDPVDFCIAQDMVAVRADRTKVYPKYLLAALRSSIVQEQVAQMHVGSLIPHFKKGDFDKLRIPVPSSEEQQFIGDIYFDLSAKIDLNRRMNETLEGMARALFKSWFVDFDPVRAKADNRDPGLPKHVADLFPDRFLETELGEIPEGWGLGTLADMSALNPEVWSAETRPPQISYVDLSNTKWGRIEDVVVYQQPDAPSRAQRALRRGDTIVGTVRPGNGSYAFIAQDGLTGSTGFAVLRPKRREYEEFVYLAATARDNIQTLSHLSDGGAYPAVRPELVAATPVAQPPNPVLEAFACVARPLLAKTEAGERESRALASLRDALLPKLISGEIRVPDAVKTVEATL